MKAYIRSATTVSPQNTFGTGGFLDDIVIHEGNRLNCVEPDYSEAIDPRLIRRMSRIIKMSLAGALACLKAADVKLPDAIVTGTAYGCLEDTGTFLTNMVEQHEEPITPTAFVQSTHNTIGSQVALFIKCNSYNNTFVSGGGSFENALLDAMLLLTEDANTNVLLGGMDEITDMSHLVLSRFGIYKRELIVNTDLFNTQTKGTINGEGAAFFLLSNQPSTADLASVDAVSTFYKPLDVTETEGYIRSFLAANNIESGDIDLLITGNNGDVNGDKIYQQLQQTVFNDIASIKYKHLCGEYPTSTAFATWLAANILKNNNIPAALPLTGTSSERISKVLIYNHYHNIYHALILLSAC